MRADIFTNPRFETKARRFRPRRTTGDRLREALLVLAEAKASILTHEEKAWASVTFTGTRHTLTIDFDGEEAVAAGERLIAALPDHEFAIAGQLVADASVNKVDHLMHPQPRMLVTVVLLLLDEA